MSLHLGGLLFSIAPRLVWPTSRVYAFAPFKERTSTASPLRVRFEAAEIVFGQKCPAQLRGVLVPAPRQMRFRFGKSLQDLPRPPIPGMQLSPCRVCWKMPPQCAVCHEAFACEENFDVGGVPAKGYRQLFRLGLLDAAGDII